MISTNSTTKINQNFKQIKLFCWGFGKYGQIGSLDYHYSFSPIEVNLEKSPDYTSNENFKTTQPLINPQYVSCGEFHTALIDDKNQLYCFGKNTYGQLGTGDTFISGYPRLVNFKEQVKIVQVACGGEHTIALGSKNELFTWGLNLYGQLGLINGIKMTSPTKITQFREFEFNEKSEIIGESKKNILEKEKILEIAAGSHHSIFLTSANRIYSCGYNKYGALGHYDKKEKSGILHADCFLFTQSIIQYENKKFSNIASGMFHSGCIIDNSEVCVWGVADNSSSYASYPTPTLLQPTKKNKWTKVNELYIGICFFVIIADDGDVYTTGNNSYGELANNSQNGRKNFEKVNLPEPVLRISVGYSHVIAITVNHKVYGWGCNKNGQLIDQNLERILNPKELTILTELAPLQVVSGGYHSAILSVQKNFRNINIIKSVPQNSGLQLNYIDSHLTYIRKILETQETRKKEIQEQEEEIEKITRNIEKLKVTSLKPKRSERDKDTLQSTGISGHEVFEEDIKITELQYPDGNNFLGGGTFGEVKKCLWRKTLVAVKFLTKSSDPKMNQENVKSFVEELNILKKLRHPNILLYLGACISGPEYFLVTEYCENGNLFSYLHETTENNSLTDGSRIKIALEIARGVNYLHSFDPPILHRDLKSLNVLLDKNFQVKIADFGWARVREDHMTKRRGTFQWMAPEVIKNHNYTEKADVFSFAIILWELYNQEPPYDKLDKFEVAKKVANDPTFRPTIKETLPSKVKKLMIKCWDHDPNERPTFEAIIDYLETLRRERN